MHGLDNERAVPQTIANVEEALRRNFEYRRDSHGSMGVLRPIGTARAAQLLQKLAAGPQDTQQQKNRALMAKYTLDGLTKMKLAKQK
jgi:hypothetical protein